MKNFLKRIFKRRKPTTKALDDAFRVSAGGWKHTVDCEKLLKDIYDDRHRGLEEEIK